MQAPMLVDIRHLFSDTQWAALDDFCRTLDPHSHPGYYRLDNDSITPDGYWGKDVPIACMLLHHLLTTAISATGVALRPCHSVIRYTPTGGETAAHADGKDKVPPYSLLMPISTSGQGHPFLVKDLAGKTHTFTPRVGQGVLLNATEMEHSRPPLYDPWHVHAILTYTHAGDSCRRSWEASQDATTRDDLAGIGWSIISEPEWNPDLLIHGLVDENEIAELLTLLDDPRTSRGPGYVLYKGTQKIATDSTIRLHTIAEPPDTPTLARILSRIDRALDRPKLKRGKAYLQIYEQGDFFAEHIDNSEMFPRCVTAVLLLSEADGGDLTIADRSIDLHPGTLVVLSGDVPHAVNVVRNGRRVSLVVGYSER